MISDAVIIDKEILGGTPVFSGTRVPIQTLIDYLKGGDSLEEFLEDFPSVTKVQSIQVLKIQDNKINKF